MLEDISRNLRKLRRERDLTQGQLARFVGMSQQLLSAIEHGHRPKLALVERLAHMLGVDPNALLQSASEADRRDVERLARERQATERAK